MNLGLVVADWQPVGRPVLLPARPTELAGREAELEALRKRLAGPDGPRIAVLHGLGGTGKTSLAAEYAHRHKAEFGIIWYLAAEERTSVETGFASLGALLGASGRTLDPRDPVSAVHAVLADSPLSWLLIFDNAPDPASIRDFVPGDGRGQVLITSQHGLWPAGQGIEVRALEVAVAADYLANQTGDPDRAAAGDLAAELGGLPLALAHAAAYIRAATGTSLADYQDLFLRRRAEVLARREETSGHPAGVAATLGLALSRLERTAPDAVNLLRLLAVLAPEPVPLKVLLADAGIAQQLGPDVAAALAPLLGDDLAVGDAVSALRTYSLVTPASGGMIVVHRLVQAVTLDLHPAGFTQQWRAAAATLVDASIPADPQILAAWPVCAALLPHALAVLNLTSAGIRKIANSLGFSGGYAAARDLFRQVARECEDLKSPDDRETLIARANLAYWTAMAGDPPAARDTFAALVPVSERVLGPEDPDTLVARANLAYWTGVAGDPATARDMYAALVPVSERVLGPEHPDTLTFRANVARYTGLAGDPAAARDMYVALVPVREQVSGPDHPLTLPDRGNLAYWTAMAGDPATARDMYAALVPVSERVLGPEHPDTLVARAQVANWTGVAGDPAAARDMYAALVPVSERALGPEHRATLTFRSNLAYWTPLGAENEQARRLAN